MKLVNQENKKTWIVFGVSLLVAVCAVCFLPKDIPVHFSGGAADGYANKLWIFAFPLLGAALLLISEVESFRNWCMHYKTVTKTESQYYTIIFGVVLLVTIAEIVIVGLSLL